jgi:hypothetical protein
MSLYAVMVYHSYLQVLIKFGEGMGLVGASTSRVLRQPGKLMFGVICMRNPIRYHLFYLGDSDNTGNHLIHRLGS